MAKIFAAQAELNNHPSRNNFDLSHKIHMTGKMGTLYPVFCKPVVPGDSFRIQSGCVFNFMPMPYPTQTRMRFIQHFFYVRNKNLWDNWENWLQGLEEHTPPFIDQPASFFKTGELADFLGIPTTSVGIGSQTVTSSFGMTQQIGSNTFSIGLGTGIRSLSSLSTDKFVGSLFGLSADDEYYLSDVVFVSDSISGVGLFDKWVSPDFPNVPMARFVLAEDMYFYYTSWVAGTPAVDFDLVIFGKSASDSNFNSVEGAKLIYTIMPSIPYHPDENGVNHFDITNFSVPLDSINGAISQTIGTNGNIWIGLVCHTYNSQIPISQFDLISNVQFPLKSKMSISEGVDIEQLPQSNPYFSSSNIDDDTIKISALPFRAYESVYNAFYRNQHGNQPFLINGQPQYNRYNTTTLDGPDSTPYKLFQRNWELDAYTSALPSPQQGVAPVVGITALGELSVVDPETGVTSTARLLDADNGIQVEDVNLGDPRHMPYIVSLASSGITINDFRQVNSLQKFLETNIRKGFRYTDFIEGHFGKGIKDSIMDMPEFIGGFSQQVEVNMISNTTSGTNAEGFSNLGEYGGQASAIGGTNHTISHYCDDYGFIIGIMCLVPDPTYSQLLPKHFNIKQPLDFYFPEFAQIGMQPITYEEVCPVQSHLAHASDENIKLTDVFGYQRPNHDLVWSPDTLHGEFKKSMNKFIINRVYSNRPELSNDFLIIKPEETNSIFNYTAPDADVFVGQVAFDVKAKRPIPRIVIPSLGR